MICQDRSLPCWLGNTWEWDSGQAVTGTLVVVFKSQGTVAWQSFQKREEIWTAWPRKWQMSETSYEVEQNQLCRLSTNCSVHTYTSTHLSLTYTITLKTIPIPSDSPLKLWQPAKMAPLCKNVPSLLGEWVFWYSCCKCKDTHTQTQTHRWQWGFPL